MTSIVSHEGGFNAPCSRVQIVVISPEKTWAKFTKSLIFSNEFAYIQVLKTILLASYYLFLAKMYFL